MRKREFKPNKGHDKENAEVIKTVPDLVKKNASENQLHGVIPILETLRAGTRSIEKLLIAEGVKHHRLHELLALSRASNVPIQRTSRIDLDRMVPNGATHQGVIAIVSSANYHNTEDLLESLISKIGTDDQPLVVVLDGVEDPRNLGAIIRTAECAGAHAIFIPERRASGLTETVAKASAGALEYLPVARVTNLNRLIDELKRNNIWTIGVEADAKKDYTSWDWTQPSALIFGGEGKGLHRLVRENCDEVVRIPLRGHISSLNVSVAVGILLYEALRQRVITKAP